MKTHLLRGGLRCDKGDKALLHFSDNARASVLNIAFGRERKVGAVVKDLEDRVQVRVRGFQARSEVGSTQRQNSVVYVSRFYRARGFDEDLQDLPNHSTIMLVSVSRPVQRGNQRGK